MYFELEITSQSSLLNYVNRKGNEKLNVYVILHTACSQKKHIQYLLKEGCTVFSH